MESMRASTTDDNVAFADSDKSNVKIYFLTVPYGAGSETHQDAGITAFRRP